jgi:hypothetical protein
VWEVNSGGEWWSGLNGAERLGPAVGLASELSRQVDNSRTLVGASDWMLYALRITLTQ